MECLALTLRFEAKDGQRLGPPTPLEAVYESLAGRVLGPEEGSPSSDFPLVPFRIDLSSDKTSVEVGRTTWTFHTEKAESIDHKAKWLAELTSRAKSKSYLDDPRISAVSVESAWVFPYVGSWEDVVGQYCKAFFAPATLPAEAMDASALFDVTLSDAELHVQSGPMNKQQLLREYARFLDASEVPETMVFMFCKYDSQSDIETALPAGVERAKTEARRVESVFQGATQ